MDEGKIGGVIIARVGTGQARGKRHISWGEYGIGAGGRMETGIIEISEGEQEMAG